MSDVPEIFAFPDTEALARATASQLGVEVHPIEVHTFPDGESLVRAVHHESDRALIFRSLDHPNDKLFELLLASDALRRQGVREVGLVAPYLGYMRQDRTFRPGEPISQRVIARLLDSSFEAVVTIEAHLHRIERLSEVFSGRASSVSAARPIARWLRDQPHAGIVIGPDAESEPWIRAIAEQADLEWLVSSKTRHADRHVEIDVPTLPPNTRLAWIVDDIASSGATLEALVRILKSRGVQEVHAIIVHALLDDDTPARLSHAGLDRLVSTDSIAHPSNAISLAPLLAEIVSTSTRQSGTS